MPLPSDTGLTFRVRAPSTYERGRAGTVSLEARAGASLVAPDSGTMTLKSPTGATVWTGSVSISGSVASATVPSLSLPSTLAYGDGYSEEWDLVFSGTTRTARREAYIARRALHCPVTQADLEARHPQLASTFGANVSSLQAFIDEAWGDTLRRLVSSGRWPEAVVEVSSLRRYVLESALSYVFGALLTATPGASTDRYASMREVHATAAQHAWADVRYRQDVDQDGTADTDARNPASRTVSRGAAGMPWGWRHRRVL